MAQTLFERIWEAHVVRGQLGEPALIFVDLHLVHEVTSPQAFEGLRLAGRARAPARSHGRDDGPLRPDAAGADRGRPRARPARRAARELRGVRDPALRHGLRARGDRARDRARARADAAGDDRRVRRQPHLDPRRLRRARDRDRHLGGRARARDADAAAAPPEDAAPPLRRRAAARADREGHDPRRDRAARRRRRRRPRDRVHGRGDRGALDGGPDDRLQHVDRGRGPRGDDRARRHHLRLPRGPPGRAEGRRVGAGARPLARAPVRSGRVLRRHVRGRRLLARSRR